MPFSDILTLGAGIVGWSIAVPAVRGVGQMCANDEDGTYKVLAIAIGTGIAYVTTPLLSFVMGWNAPYDKVRGIALALGAAQVTDGIIHMFYPHFYSNDKNVGIASASNIFLGAGLLGIFSAYQ